MPNMDEMTDQVIAGDLLIASKSAIKDYAAAIAECATPEVRKTLHRHLDDAILQHEHVSMYMIDNGYYDPYDLQNQISMDQQNAQKSMTQK
ncbi:spore coat protein [Halobacillus ihumii]|uniref:spore coat protein n=1 Tax=Halobacillus ihumii TaxID=2686092 RepID=UPI0013D18ADA|nr:spore coat protein [Halobacillus ihumii]